jgi:hypothetical protein
MAAEGHRSWSAPDEPRGCGLKAQREISMLEPKGAQDDQATQYQHLRSLMRSRNSGREKQRETETDRPKMTSQCAGSEGAIDEGAK